MELLKDTPLHEFYIEYNDGNDVCKYFEEERRLCSIYDERPIFCRGKDLYLKYYRSVCSLDEFYAANKEICKRLRRESN